MSSQEYYDKAKELYSTLNKLKNEGVNGNYDYSKSDSLIREFQHLVYAFDKELPLNKELSDINHLLVRDDILTGGVNVEQIDKILYYIRFFEDYINNYEVF